MQTCYQCKKDSENIALYYNIDPILYYDPKIVTKENIPQDAKPICNDCSISFFLKRQNDYENCAICKTFHIYPGVEAKIYKGVSEIQSNMEHGNWEFVNDVGKLKYNLKDDDNICKKCFDDIIEKGEVTRINIFRDRNCDVCKKEFCIPEHKKGEATYFELKCCNKKVGKYVYLKNGNLKHELKTEVNFENGYICDDCITELGTECNESIECNSCKSKYMKGDSYYNNVKNCDSKILDKLIVPDFKSKYSNLLSRNECIKFVKELTDLDQPLEFGEKICDDCIDKLIESKICVKCTN